ncbi:Zinc finger protein ZAT3 [Vitis vinifera]|uniref:Zinc finger protein ZAT3 n=1 Tax=Vitis vinifera TaxID=29760 RepID=A0A438DUM9_VITVI|nr:Zinc finger protein ZAT3 [Vitis vinifera]
MDDDQKKDYCKILEGGEREDDVALEKGALKEKPAAANGGPMMKLNHQSSWELNGEDNVREPRICSVCKREFSSGKALGGHMRVHIQASKKEDELLNKKTAKLKKQSVNGPGSTTNNADDTTCSLCGKNFPSRKSLFGHMRCHPEREWRGIQPPPTAKNSSSSTLSELLPRIMDDQFDSATTVTKCVTDLQQSLSGSGWSVTDRRGRKSFLPDADSDADADAAYNLLMLGMGFPLSWAPSTLLSATAKTGSKKRGIEASLFGNMKNSPSKKLRIGEKGSTEARNGGALMSDMNGLWAEAYWPREEAVEEESDSKNTYGSALGDQLNSNSNSNQEISMKTKKKKRRKMKLTELEATGGAAGDIVPVNQIHQKQVPTTPDRSSHNKFKNSQTMDDSACADAPPADYEHYGFTPNVNLTTQAHEAQGCNDAAAALASMLSTTHQCKCCNKTFQLVRLLEPHEVFDLNELPTMDEEDEGTESVTLAAGDASSSHNFR